MADEYLVHKVRVLGDLGLAALLCLINREHCIISTDAEYLDDLTAELELIARRSFGLTCAIVVCTPETTLNDFVTAIQLPQSQQQQQQPQRGITEQSYSYFSRDVGTSTQQRSKQPSLSPSPNHHNVSSSPSIGTPQHHQQQQQQQQQQIANVVLARDLDRAPKTVQIQCLELMRTRRIFTRTTVQACPKQFLFAAVLGAESAGQARLTKHLNDHFYISHWHDPYDGGFAEAEGEGEGSVIRSPAGTDRKQDDKMFTETEISTLSTLALQKTDVDVEVDRYIMNIIAFLRMHRAVTPGSVQPAATTHFRTLVRSLAALHGLEFVTPELVQLAARKIYAHRIVIVDPSRERSTQWGSDLAAVKMLLEGVQAEDVVEEVLGMVDVPL
ncbi:hypothetical protein GGS20DRAFT_529676 [Poronia punctata]|nr:hypothetical protein GGS20DRAFT_529676 [Poronia punctata]